MFLLPPAFDAPPVTIPPTRQLKVWLKGHEDDPDITLPVPLAYQPAEARLTTATTRPPRRK